jgi:uncharacterized protein YfaS (alpha-2-macroglobulin family)
VSVAVSPVGAIDVSALLQALDRYPYGCSEQIVSRALPLLYVNKLASAERLAIDGDVHDRIRDSIDKVLSRQDSTGAFGLWSANASNDTWLNAFVTDPDYGSRLRDGAGLLALAAESNSARNDIQLAGLVVETERGGDLHKHPGKCLDGTRRRGVDEGRAVDRAFDRRAAAIRRILSRLEGREPRSTRYRDHQ